MTGDVLEAAAETTGVADKVVVAVDADYQMKFYDLSSAKIAPSAFASNKSIFEDSVVDSSSKTSITKDIVLRKT